MSPSLWAPTSPAAPTAPPGPPSAISSSPFGAAARKRRATNRLARLGGVAVGRRLRLAAGQLWHAAFARWAGGAGSSRSRNGWRRGCLSRRSPPARRCGGRGSRGRGAHPIARRVLDPSRPAAPRSRRVCSAARARRRPGSTADASTITMLSSVAQLGDDLGQDGGSEQLRRDCAECGPAGARAGSVLGERRESSSATWRSPVSAVVRPAAGIEVEVLRERRSAQVELDQDRAATRQRDRVREIDRDRRLALTGDGARHQQGVELAGDRGEIERAAQDAIRLEQLVAILRRRGPEGRLRDRGERGSRYSRSNSSIELMRGRGTRAGTRARTRSPARSAARSRPMLVSPEPDGLDGGVARPMMFAPPPRPRGAALRRCRLCSSAVRSAEPAGSGAICAGVRAGRRSMPEQLRLGAERDVLFGEGVRELRRVRGVAGRSIRCSGRRRWEPLRP